MGALAFVGHASGPRERALRGIALVQLREYDRAKADLAYALDAFDLAGNAGDAARAAAALAEIELQARNVPAARETLRLQRRRLVELRDWVNTAYIEILLVRLAVLAGEVDTGLAGLRRLDALTDQIPPEQRRPIAAFASLAAGEAARARRAFGDSERCYLRAEALNQGRNRLMAEEVTDALAGLRLPKIQWTIDGSARWMSEVELERHEGTHEGLVIDLISGRARQPLSQGGSTVLEGRFSLLRLAGALSGTEPRSARELFEDTYGVRYRNASHHARLKVAISRLRKVLGSQAVVHTGKGWRLGLEQVAVVVAAPADPIARIHARLGDGEAWSSAALSTAVGLSKRHTQRALRELGETGRVEIIGAGRATRYRIAGMRVAIASPMLLP